jgi:hypothetical protein
MDRPMVLLVSMLRGCAGHTEGTLKTVSNVTTDHAYGVPPECYGDARTTQGSQVECVSK